MTHASFLFLKARSTRSGLFFLARELVLSIANASRLALNPAIAASRLTAEPLSSGDCGNRQVIDHTQGRSRGAV
jgi:hypothetical protein